MFNSGPSHCYFRYLEILMDWMVVFSTRSVDPHARTNHTMVIALRQTHNHAMMAGNSLQHRPVSAGTRQLFMRMFAAGMTPRQALAMHQSNLCSEHGKLYQQVLFMPVSHRAYGLYGQVTVETVGWPCRPYWPYGFSASEQKFRTVRLTIETIGGDRTRPYALTVSGRSYGLYGQLLRSLQSLRLAATVCTVSTVSCYGL